MSIMSDAPTPPIFMFYCQSEISTTIMILVNIQYFFVVLRVNDLLRYLISFVSLCTLRANTNVSSYLNDLLARSIPQCGRILNDVVIVTLTYLYIKLFLTFFSTIH